MLSLSQLPATKSHASTVTVFAVSVNDNRVGRLITYKYAKRGVYGRCRFIADDNSPNETDSSDFGGDDIEISWRDFNSRADFEDYIDLMYSPSPPATKLDKRLQAIEDSRKPRLDNLLNDVNYRPGELYMGVMSIFSRDPVVKEWRKVIIDALRNGDVERDVFGKLWPAGRQRPSATYAVFSKMANAVEDTWYTIKTVVISGEYIAGLMTAYIVFGFFFGLGMERKIPAMNALGVLYYMVVWPWFFASGAYGAPDPYVPQWAFTFN